MDENKSVMDLGLPVRTSHALRRFGIHDVSALLDFAERRKLTAIPGIGENGKAEIISAIERMVSNE